MNLIVLCGNLTKDPELNTSSNGNSFCKFSIAVNRDYGEEGVDYFNCTAFGNRADTIAKYFNKGKKILIKGKVKITDYENKEGSKRRSFDIIIKDFEFVSNKSSYDTKEEEPEVEPVASQPAFSAPASDYAPDPNGLPF